MISAAVLVKNQKEQLERCLDSLKWCDEILVIDDDSTDGSGDVAKKFDARVYRRALKGDFSAQRNFALQKAKNDWVFFVDADEVVPSELAQEIYQQISQFITPFHGFFIPRKDFMWGREIKFGEMGKSKFVRLGRKDKGEWKGNVHETWKIIGEIGNFQSSIYHYPHPTIREFLSEINTYSTLRAQELSRTKTQISSLSIVLYPTGKFLFNYGIKFGFLDGVPGMVIALMMSFHSFLVRGKLWILRQQRRTYEFGH